MTKILVAIKASPEEISNSTVLLNSFLDGVKSVSDVGINIYDSNTINLHYYRHDYNEPKDDETEFKELAKSLQHCSGLVIATPTYNFNVPSNLKNIIDRLTFIALDKTKLNILRQPQGQLKHIKPFFIATGGSPLWAEKILFFLYPIFWLRIIFLYYGAHIGGGIYGDSLSFSKPAKDRPRLLAKCYKKGIIYGKYLNKKSHC